MSTCTAVFLQGHSLSPSAVDSGMEELGGEGRRAWLVRTFGSISRGRKQGTETKLKVTTTAPRGLSFPLSKFSKTLSSLPVAVIGCLYWVTFSFHFYFLVTWINCEIIEKRKKKQKQGLPGGPAVKTPCFQCRRRGFGLWSGNSDLTCCWAQPKEKQ